MLWLMTALLLHPIVAEPTLAEQFVPENHLYRVTLPELATPPVLQLDPLIAEMNSFSLMACVGRRLLGRVVGPLARILTDDQINWYR